MDFYKELISKYIKLNFPDNYQEISKIGGTINWYLADSSQNFISCKKSNNLQIVELDIKSAFPTIITNILGSDSEFIKQMNEIEDKTAKNIFISTNLKDTGYLEQLNNICKLCIFGIVFDKEPDEYIEILELKKDGILISCNQDTINRLTNLHNSQKEYTQFLLNHNFIFHYDFYQWYIRSNRTSFFITNDNQLKIKGIYKYVPIEIEKIIYKTLSGEKIDFNNLIEIYSSKIWKLISLNHLNDTLKKYYICNGDKIINFQGKYERYTPRVEVNPRLYLKLFIFKTLLAIKMDQ